MGIETDNDPMANNDNKVGKRPKAKGGAAKVVTLTTDGTTHIRVTQACADMIRRLVAKRVLNGRMATKQVAIEDAIALALVNEDQITHAAISGVLRKTGKLTGKDVKAG